MVVRRRVAIGRMVVAGSARAGGEEHLFEVVEKAFAQNAPDVRRPLFFTPSAKCQAAGEGVRRMVRPDGP